MENQKIFKRKRIFYTYGQDLRVVQEMEDGSFARFDQLFI